MQLRESALNGEDPEFNLWLLQVGLERFPNRNPVRPLPFSVDNTELDGLMVQLGVRQIHISAMSKAAVYAYAGFCMTKNSAHLRLPQFQHRKSSAANQKEMLP